MISGPSGNKLTWVLRLIASGAVSAFVVTILLKQLPGSQDERTPTVFNALQNVVWPLIGLYVLCTLGQTLLRAIRYGVLLRAAGEREVPNMFHLLLVTMTRNMFVDLIPARAGELIYIGLLNRGYKLSGQSCLSSMAISFVFDIIALGFVILGLLAEHLLRAEWDPRFAMAAAFFLLVPLGILYALYAVPRPLMRWARKLCSRLPVVSRWTDKVLAFGDRIADVMETTRRSGTTGRTLALSIGVRLFKYTGLFFAFRAVTIHGFPDLAGATMIQALTVLLTSEFAASLPAPTLMGFGTYEAGGVAAWEALGYKAAAAANATFAFHICSQIVDYSIGGLGLLLFTIVGGKRPAATAPAPSPGAALAAGSARGFWIKAVLAGVLTLGCAALAVRQYQMFQKLGSFKAPEVGTAIEEAPRIAVALPPLLGGRSGFVVWSSNRGGNHDIWKMDLPGGTMHQLTRDPHVDYFPRISPDGRRLVFARSREPWVSQRNETPWDTWILDLDSSRETKIAEFANAPTWLDDDTILFQRCGTQVVSRTVSKGTETVLFEAGHGEIPGGALLQTPSYHTGARQLAVTIRGALRTTALIDPGLHVRRIDDGCQLHWVPDGTQLLGVTSSKAEHSFRLTDPRTAASTPFFDSPTDRSHEYFPKLSPDGKFLVYGASVGGKQHEHDSADYEIFFWNVGSPMETAVRLTWHTGNDNWPDVYLTR